MEISALAAAMPRIQTRHCRDVSLTGRVRIDEVDTTELERFRYAIYIEELGKPLASADHKTRRLPDPADPSAFHFTFHGHSGEIVGCVRLHLHPRLPQGVVQQLGLADFERQHDRPFGYVSKLMVAKGFRGGAVSVALMKAMVEFGHGAPNHGEVAFFHCHPKLVRLYEKFGFRRFGAAFEDAQSGSTQVPMFIMGGDTAHFRACASPMALTAERFNIPPARKAQLLRLIPGICPTQGK